jgi:hypothetical protein
MADRYEHVRQRPRPGRASPLPAAVPRKFGIGTLLVVSAAYALLFGVLRFVNTPGFGTASIALFLTAVGIAQMIFGARAARTGSVIAGTIVFPVLAIANLLMVERNFSLRMLPDMGWSCVCLLIFGAICGYLGGTLVAGVFLAMELPDRIMRGFGDVPITTRDAAALDESPTGLNSTPLEAPSDSTPDA